MSNPVHSTSTDLANLDIATHLTKHVIPITEHSSAESFASQVRSSLQSLEILTESQLDRLKEAASGHYSRVRKSDVYLVVWPCTYNDVGQYDVEVAGIKIAGIKNATVFGAKNPLGTCEILFTTWDGLPGSGILLFVSSRNTCQPANLLH